MKILKTFFFLSLLMSFSASAETVNWDDPNMLNGLDTEGSEAVVLSATAGETVAVLDEAFKMAETNGEIEQRSISSNAPVVESKSDLAIAIEVMPGICPMLDCDSSATDEGVERGSPAKSAE